MQGFWGHRANPCLTGTLPIVGDLLGKSGRSVARAGSLSGCCPAHPREDGNVRRQSRFELLALRSEAVVFTVSALPRLSL